MRPSDRPSPPTAELFDLLGRRWALRILWELRDAGLVEQRDRAGYALTDPGSKLLARLKFFDDWASQWAEQWGRAARVRGERTDQGGKR